MKFDNGLQINRLMPGYYEAIKPNGLKYTISRIDEGENKGYWNLYSQLGRYSELFPRLKEVVQELVRQTT